MKVFKHLSLKYKLTLMLAAPLMAALFFAGQQILSAQKLSTDADQIELIANFAVHTGGLVDTLQRERGFSTAYLISRGQKFQAQMEKQRLKTAEALTQFGDDLERLDLKRFGDEFNQHLQDGLKSVSELKRSYPDIDKRKIHDGRLIRTYSAVIHHFLSLIEHFSQFSPDKEVTILVTAYADFLQGKEKAAVEREILAKVFEQDQFIGNDFATFNSSIVSQEIYLESFLALIGMQQADSYKKLMDESQVNRSRHMRESAVASSDYGALNVDWEEWFEVQTAKLGLLKDTEDMTASRMIQKAQDIRAEAERHLFNAITISLAAIVISIIAAWLIFSQIMGSINLALTAARRIAAGNLDVNITIPSGDEIGDMLRALNDMRAELKHGIEAEREIALENSKIKQALDSVTSAAMLVGTDNVIIYHNDSLKTVIDEAIDDFRSVTPDFETSEITGNTFDRLFTIEKLDVKLLSSMISRCYKKWLLQ